MNFNCNRLFFVTRHQSSSRSDRTTKKTVIAIVIDALGASESGGSNFQNTKVARDGYIRRRLLRILILSKRAVKMSDSSLSLEDIDS